MTLSKWVMKQYWRAGAIRAIFGLLMGMLVLGRYYYEFIPSLHALGIIGAIALSVVVLFLFMIIGYLYDAKARLWNEQFQVVTERNPFNYVPSIKSLTAEYPIVFAILHSLKEILNKTKVDTANIDELIAYVDSYFSLRPDRMGDIKRSQTMAREYLSTHPFYRTAEIPPTGVGYRARIAKAFQVQVWRLAHVQSLTGLGQDVLVFAALYVPVIFSEVTVDRVVPLEYLLMGIFILSLPLYIGLIAAGWYYDKKLRMWSSDFDVKAERNPFSYVPDPHLAIYVRPFFFALLHVYYEIQRQLNIDTCELERIVNYLGSYWDLSSERDGDMQAARELRLQLGGQYNFISVEEGES